MANLHQLTAEYRMLQDLAEDFDGQDEQIGLALESLEGALEQKALGIVYVLRNMGTDADALEEEAKRLASKAKAIRAREERLRAYVLGAMQYNGVTEIKGPTVTLRVQQNPESVTVDDEANIPAQFIRARTAYTIDKAAILKAYRESGEIVPGTRVERGVRLAIK